MFRFNVQGKILGLAGILLAALAVLALVGVTSLSKVSTLAGDAFDNATQPLSALGTARAKANETRALVNNHILTTGADEKRQFEADIKANDELIATNLAKVEPTLATAEGKAAFQEIKSGLEKYNEARAKVIALSNQAANRSLLEAADVVERAYAVNVKEGRPRFTAVAEGFTRLFDSKVALAASYNKQADDTYASKRTLSILLFLGALVAGVAAAFLIARPIRSGATQMLVAAEKISQGDLEADVSIKSNDELGRTGEAFHAMLEYLHETAAAARQIGEGDLTVTLEPRSEQDVLRHAFVDMTTRLRDLVAELRASAATVSSASEQLTSTAEETSKAVDEIATAVGEVASGAEEQVRQVTAADEAMREAAQAADRSANAATEAAGVAGKAREVTQEGVVAVGHASEAMEAVRGNASDAATVISGLAERSKQIADFVQTITGIAEQTNLLALNAAIEAARAGEQGRGFAVVAEEVRKLAEGAGVAAGTISGLVAEIATDTERSVRVIEAGAEHSAEGARTVAQAREAFERIATAVEELAGRSDDIAAAAQQISATTEQVEHGIAAVAKVAEGSSATAEEVSATTEQTSAAAQEISASAQELSATARGLEELIGRFKVAA
jgi:methyl-accepting chemotaxis protein